MVDQQLSVAEMFFPPDLSMPWGNSIWQHTQLRDDFILLECLQGPLISVSEKVDERIL